MAGPEPGAEFLQRRLARATAVPPAERSPQVAAFVESMQLLREARELLPLMPAGTPALPDSRATRHKVMRAGLLLQPPSALCMLPFRPACLASRLPSPVNPPCPPATPLCPCADAAGPAQVCPCRLPVLEVPPTKEETFRHLNACAGRALGRGNPVQPELGDLLLPIPYGNGRDKREVSAAAQGCQRDSGQSRVPAPAAEP